MKRTLCSIQSPSQTQQWLCPVFTHRPCSSGGNINKKKTLYTSVALALVYLQLAERGKKAIFTVHIYSEISIYMLSVSIKLEVKCAPNAQLTSWAAHSIQTCLLLLSKIC